MTKKILGLGGLLLTWALPVTAADYFKLQRDWWQWTMSIPASHSPVFDKTGNRCGVAQRGDIWFLAGSTGGKTTRTCAVPAGVQLLVPVVNTFCYPDAAYSDAFCVSDTDAFIDSFDKNMVRLTVDGSPATTMDVRDTSDFNFAVDANGVFGAKPGVYRATIARGYWGLIGPLEPGAHTITIDASGPLFSLLVTYNLTVVAPSN